MRTTEPTVICLFSLACYIPVATAQSHQAIPPSEKNFFIGTPAVWVQPKTPWGDPDLQGIWTNTTTTPFERPDDLKDKVLLSEAERATRDVETAKRVSFDNPARAGDPGAYNEFWMERGRLLAQTSLVIDPPDGCCLDLSLRVRSGLTAVQLPP